MSVDIKYKCNNCEGEIKESDIICPHCETNINETGRKVSIDLTEILRLRDQVEITQIQQTLSKKQKRVE